jgi:hypothetical protein
MNKKGSTYSKQILSIIFMSFSLQLREDNIKMDLQEVEWGGMDWIAPAQDRDRW